MRKLFQNDIMNDKRGYNFAAETPKHYIYENSSKEV